MFSLLLAIIYISFISLGLPDSLLGSAWPVMYSDLGVPVSFAGIISMIIAGGTIVSSLMSDKLTKKFGAGLITALSVCMTAFALFGFSASGSFLALCLFAVPYGLGAGAVDAALNNFVALHYSSRHMSWLHCFWGVGAAISPYIMSYCITDGLGWTGGYKYVAILQVVLSAMLFLSLPLWKKQTKSSAENQSDLTSPNIRSVLKIKGVNFVLIAFFAYCALETTAGLWSSSYLVLSKGVNSETAAKFASLFFLGITIGRFACGFVADRLGDKALIKIGLIVLTTGIFALLVPKSLNIISLGGLVIIGLGCAPIYPSIIHQTPKSFGKENSQAIIGIQMASAYTGSTFMPPLFGLIANYISIAFYPFYLLAFAILMMIMIKMLNKAVKA